MLAVQKEFFPLQVRLRIPHEEPTQPLEEHLYLALP